MSTISDFNMLCLEAPQDIRQITDGTEPADEVVEVENPTGWVRSLVHHQERAEADLWQLWEVSGSALDRTNRPIQDIERAYMTLAQGTQYQDPASTSPFVSTGKVGGVCSSSGPTHTSGVLTLPVYSHFRLTRTPCVSSVFSRYPSRLGWSLGGSSHTSWVGSLFSRYPSHLAWSLCSSSHTPCVGSLFSRYSSLPAWSLCGSSHTPCVGSLFSRYLSHPAWSLRGSSHTPCMGSLFSRHPSRPAWSLRGSSHTPCVGSLFSGSGGRSAGHGEREVGLWREIIDCVEKNLQTSYRALPL